MRDIAFYILYLLMLFGGFVILLCVSSLIFSVAYKFLPAFKKWADSFMAGE